MPWITQAQNISPPGYTPLEELEPSDETKQRGLAARYAEGFSNNIFGASLRAAYRFGAQVSSDEPNLSPEEAAAEARRQGVTVAAGIGKDGIAPAALQVLIDHQTASARRRALAEAGGATGVLGGAAEFAGGMTDPSLFIGFGAGTLAKGASLGARVVEAAKAGAVGAAAYEVPYHVARRYGGDDYTMLDSLRSVALGTVFGAALHGAGQIAESFAERRATRMMAVAQVAADEGVHLPLKPGDVSDADFNQLSREIAEANPELVKNANDDAMIDDLKTGITADRMAQRAEETPTLRDLELLDQYRFDPNDAQAFQAKAKPLNEATVAEFDRAQAIKMEEFDRAQTIKMEPGAADPELENLRTLAQEDIAEAERIAAQLEDKELEAAFERAEAPFADEGKWTKVLQSAITCARTRGEP